MNELTNAIILVHRLLSLQNDVTSFKGTVLTSNVGVARKVLDHPEMVKTIDRILNKCGGCWVLNELKTNRLCAPKIVIVDGLNQLFICDLITGEQIKHVAGDLSQAQLAQNLEEVNAEFGQDRFITAPDFHLWRLIHNQGAGLLEGFSTYMGGQKAFCYISKDVLLDTPPHSIVAALGGTSNLAGGSPDKIHRVFELGIAGGWFLHVFVLDPHNYRKVPTAATAGLATGGIFNLQTERCSEPMLAQVHVKLTPLQKPRSAETL